MQNPKTGGSRWVPDIRPENIDTYTETNTPEGGTEQSAQYKIVDAHPIIGGVLDKLAFFRTHASAVWYNKMKNITVLQKLDNLASNIGVLANLATTDKTSLVNAVNELNVKIGEKIVYLESEPITVSIESGSSKYVSYNMKQELPDSSEYVFVCSQFFRTDSGNYYLITDTPGPNNRNYIVFFNATNVQQNNIIGYVRKTYFKI